LETSINISFSRIEKGAAGSWGRAGRTRTWGHGPGALQAGTPKPACGSYGSGRHHGAKKRRIESCLALNVNELGRQGVLTPGVSGTLAWETERGAASSVAFRADSAGLVLSHDDALGAESLSVGQRVALASLPAAFGGARVYFICTGADCGRRVSMLYFAHGLFLCRRCHGLAYQSQSEDARRRARRRADKLRAQIGGPRWQAFTLKLMRRPTGMWRRTFNRLLRSAAVADAVANASYVAGLARLIGKVDRRRQRAMR